MGRIQPLELGEPFPVKQFADGLEETELGAEYILQPHGSQRYRTHYVGHVDDGPEYILKADAAGQDRRKENRQSHHDYPAEKPDTEDIPHGYPEKFRIKKFGVVGQS